MNPDKIVNDLIDAYGIDGLTEYILTAVTARKNANILADRKEESAKLSRIEQVFADALTRVKVVKFGK